MRNPQRGKDFIVMRYFWVKIPRKSMLPQKLFLGNLSMHKFPRKVFGKLHLTIGFYSSYLELITVSKICSQIHHIAREKLLHNSPSSCFRVSYRIRIVFPGKYLGNCIYVSNCIDYTFNLLLYQRFVTRLRILIQRGIII